METYLSAQAIAFLWAVVLGGTLGVLWDWFRVGRILHPPRLPLLFLQDLLFALLAAAVTAFSFTFTNYGQVRLFLLVGEALGFLLYFYTFGRLVTLFFRWFRQILKKIMNFLKKPFIFLFKRCKIILNEFWRRIRLERSVHRKTE